MPDPLENNNPASPPVQAMNAPVAPVFTAVIGSITPFQLETERIEPYLERLDLYLLVNYFSEDRKVPAMLSIIGGTVYKVLRSLLAPDLPQSKSYDILVSTLQKHYLPQPLIVAKRFHFPHCDQRSGESIAEYMAELRKLSIHCEFGDYLDQALRDRLVCGIRSKAIQKSLLQEADLSIGRAMTLAQSMEAATKNVQSFKGQEVAVQHVSASRRKQHSGKGPPTSLDSVGSKSAQCSRCGRSNHLPTECRFHEAICNNCGKKGHTATVCCSKSKQQPSKKPFQKRAGHRNRAQWVTEDDNCDDDLLINTLGDNSHPLYAELSLNGKLLKMEVDTRAAVSLISESKLKTLFPNLPVKKSRVSIRTYTGKHINMKGEVIMTVQYGEQIKALSLLVVAGNGPVLLGRNWLQHIRLNWKELGSATINHTTTDSLEALLSQYSNVFTDKLGSIKSHKANLKLQPGSLPRFHRAQPVLFAIKDVIGDELDRLESEGIVQKATHSQWAAPIVVVPKPNGKLRICGDYKVTVNPCLHVDQYPLPKPEDLFATLASGQKFTTLDLTQAYLQLNVDDESAEYTTVNTHKGLYRYKHLPFGIASAPASALHQPQSTN